METKNLLSRWWNKFTSLFSKNSPNKETENKTGTENIVITNTDSDSNLKKDKQQKADSLNDSIDNFFLENNLNLSIDENKIVVSLNAYLNDLTKRYEYLGHDDGILGSKDFDINIRSMVHATHIQETVFSALKSKIDGLEQGINSIKALKIRSQKKLDISDEFHNEMLGSANKYNKDFSISRKWIYSIIGFILLISDIPLSVNIVGTLGIIKMPDTSDSNDNKYIESTDDSNSSSSTLDIVISWIVGHWELILFSLGIAFSTIIIKVLYDEYIYTKLGKWTKELDDFSPEQRSGVIKERRTKLIINVLVLLGLFVMQFTLGALRNESVFFKNSADGNLTSLQENIKHISFWSFVLITIVLPTISGICLSISFTIDDNIKTFKRSISELKNAEKVIGDISVEYTGLIMKKSQLDVFLEEWKKADHKIKNLSSRFTSSYNQGFKRGYLIEHGHDIYKMIEGFHTESIDKEFQEKLNGQKK